MKVFIHIIIWNNKNINVLDGIYNTGREKVFNYLLQEIPSFLMNQEIPY